MNPIKLPETFHATASGDHAFVNEAGQTEIKTAIGYPGVLMRDYFAVQAMQALINRSTVQLIDKNRLCVDSYDIAEHMMDEKRKRDAADLEPVKESK